jgi:hypothetical protein
LYEKECQWVKLLRSEEVVFPNITFTLTRAWEPVILGLGMSLMNMFSMGPLPSLISVVGELDMFVVVLRYAFLFHFLRTNCSHGRHLELEVLGDNVSCCWIGDQDSEIVAVAAFTKKTQMLY